MLYTCLSYSSTLAFIQYPIVYIFTIMFYNINLQKKYVYIFTIMFYKIIFFHGWSLFFFDLVCVVESMEDKELEGKRNVCMILIGNVDKELCPSTAVEFLYKHTQVSASIFIFPSLSFEIYTRGAIMSHTDQDFQKLCDFFTDQNYIITSYSS